VFCRSELARLAKLHPEFDASQAQLAVITLGKPAETRAFCSIRAPGLACYADAGNGDGYRAYGLQRGKAAQLFGPAVWLEGARATVSGAFSGAPLGKPVGDPFMMPGVFVIETDGRVAFAYYSKHAGDYPTDGEMLALAKA
jgi:peroxiredoxin